MKPGLPARLGRVCRWGAIAIFALGYPVLAYLAAASSTRTLAGALVAIAPMAVLALVMAWRATQRHAMLALFAAALALLYTCSGWLVAHYQWVFLLEHAGTNLLLCIAFGRTLLSGQTPMISRFARVVHGDLSPALLRYTRAATWAWTLYFGVIAGLSLLLFWLAPAQIWSAFATVLGLPLLALMFAGEYAVRCQVVPTAERAGVLESIRAYRQASSPTGTPAPLS
ncbi:MAG: putative transrane protein [Polaromonas sp.]|nr:putative transrane protein [Polaromonas sp.]